MTISLLGLGAMGTRMAHRLLGAGHAVTVYNRTPARAASLVDAGATHVATPREAAAASEVVVAMVTDDAASRAVWTGPRGALAGLQPGALAIEASTLTPAWVHELAALVTSRDAAFLDAPVVGSRPQAEAGSLAVLVGGTEAEVARAQPVFEAIGGAVLHAGPTGHGAVLKLIVNALFGIQVAAVAELLAFARQAGMEETHAAELLGQLPVTSPAAKGALGAIVARRFAPLFPIDLVAKDFRYATEAASEADAPTPTAAAVRRVYEQAVEAGYGGDNVTGVAQLYL
ncbi:MAG: NAD(P)-dependent oxidoreductase [Bacteroidota bacterium]